MNKTEILEKVSKGELFIQSTSKNQTRSILNILYEKNIYNKRETFEYAVNTIYISSNNRGGMIWSDSLEFVQTHITYEEFINVIYGLAISLPSTIEDFSTEEIRKELTKRDNQRIEELVYKLNCIIEKLNSLGFKVQDTCREYIGYAEPDTGDKLVYLYKEEDD